MKRFGLNSGYIGVDRRQTEAGIAPLQKAYLERVRGGGYYPYNLLYDAYPGAAGAYSLRKLNPNFNGHAIRVRRQSDNAEQNIGFVGIQFDITSLITFCSGTNGFVTTWYDQSLFNNNLTQGVAGNQPKIYDSVSGVVVDTRYPGSKPAMYFDGSGDDFTTTILNYSRIDTYYVISPSDTTYLYPTNGNFHGFAAQQGSTSTTLTFGYGGPQLYANGNLFMGTTRNDVYNHLNLYSVVVHQNANTSGWTGGYKYFSYGGSFSFSGYVQEIIIYPSNQSLNRPGIESNINSYYNIY